MKKDDKKVDLGKRLFFRRAAAAIGGITAAGLGAKSLSKSDAASKAYPDAARQLTEEDGLHQEHLMSQKRFVLMSDVQKTEMLDDIIQHHHRVTQQS